MDKNNRKPLQSFTTVERHKIINEWLNTGCSKNEIWRKYTGRREEHGNLLRWMRQLGYLPEFEGRRPNIVSKSYTMKRKSDDSNASDSESFEVLQLRKRINELEKQLKDAELKAIAFSTMVDIAEREFKIPIRKKLNTKP
jgi:transposase